LTHCAILFAKNITSANARTSQGDRPTSHDHADEHFVPPNKSEVLQKKTPVRLRMQPSRGKFCSVEQAFGGNSVTSSGQTERRRHGVQPAWRSAVSIPH